MKQNLTSQNISISDGWLISALTRKGKTAHIQYVNPFKANGRAETSQQSVNLMKTTDIKEIMAQAKLTRVAHIARARKWAAFEGCKITIKRNLNPARI